VENNHVETVDRDRIGWLSDRRRAGVLGIAVLRHRVGLLLPGFAVLRLGLLPRSVLRPEVTAADVT
jgi:hypothetical protein